MELSRLFFEQLGENPISELAVVESNASAPVEIEVFQCGDCFTIYDEKYGSPDQNIAPNTPFEELPKDYLCSVCESEKESFQKIRIGTPKVVS